MVMETEEMKIEEEKEDILDVLNDVELPIRIDKKFHQSVIENLERVIILLEDNKNIKDKNDFYKGDDLMYECKDILEYLKGNK